MDKENDAVTYSIEGLDELGSAVAKLINSNQILIKFDRSKFTLDNLD
jgi:hypothetical protein